MTTDRREDKGSLREYRSAYGPQRERAWAYGCVVLAPLVAVFGVVTAFNAEAAPALGAFSFLLIGVPAMTIGINRLASMDYVTVSRAGLRPSRWRDFTVPAAAVAGVEVRRWPPVSRNGEDRYCLSLLLADGRYAMLPMLQRPGARVTGSLGIWTRSPGWSWRALSTRQAPIRWTVLADAEVCAVFEAELVRMWGGWGDDAALARRLRHPTLIDAAPAYPGRPRPPVIGEPRSTPTGPKPAPRWLTRARELPTWRDLPARAFYWSRAGHRKPGSGPSGVGFVTGGVELASRGRRQLVPYDVIDGFDIRLCEDNVWRVVLVLRDGAFFELPGMTHGDWSENPLLLHNELRWSIDGRPAGSMPWGSDGAPIIAARLNAQLATSRGAGPGTGLQNLP